MPELPSFVNRRTHATVRIASWELAFVAKQSPQRRITRMAIRAALEKRPNLEFVDVVTGQTTTVAEARKHGILQLTIRYQNDRQIHVVRTDG